MTEKEYLYSLKQSLVTAKEFEYLKVISNSLPIGYYVQPQVNLASIITKNGNSRYHNELFRNVDACIFDMNYRPIVVIEINDITHTDYNRRNRDVKVKNICDEAGIKVVTFWTKYGVNQEYISKTINEAIAQAPYFQRVKHSTDKTEKVEQTQEIPHSIPYTVAPPNSLGKKKNGCYVATAVYGSYDCSEVWVLRRYRDYNLAQNVFGRAFIKMYYFISPTVVKIFGKTNWFKAFFKKILDKKIIKLKNCGYSDKPYEDLY